METSQNNPIGNKFGSGVTDAQVEHAIQASGYPLQLIVSQALSKDFSLQEEWSFPDPETKSARTIDLVATKYLFDWKGTQPRVRPSLHLVLECKQADLPYVFFLSGGQPWIPDFPIISGLKANEIILTSDDDPSSWLHSPLQVLGLDGHPYLRKSAPFCVTFSKCVRKGSDLILSGSDAYQSIVFPILKAVSHFDKVQRPSSTAYYCDCSMVIGVAVLDAPMIGVHLTDSGSKTELLPWVRVVRHQPRDGQNKYDCSQTFGIDVVHKDYLMTYINRDVTPFAEDFSRLVLKHPDVLADGRGFVSGMGANCWTNIEPRLQRATVATKRKRWKASLMNIFSVLSGKKTPYS